MPIKFESVPCRRSDVDPETFFPDPTEYEKIKQAKSLCKQCHLTSECLSFAFATRSVGIFGGTTEEERKRIRRRESRSGSLSS